MRTQHTAYVLIIVLTVLLSACADPIETNRRELAGIAQALNEKCPQVLDSETRLDGIEVKAPNTLVYKYTLLNLEAARMDTVLFYRAMWPGIISTIKTSAEMKKLRDAETKIEYVYFDKANRLVYTFRINPDDYR